MDDFVGNILDAMHNADPEIDLNVGANNTQVPNEGSDVEQPDPEILDKKMKMMMCKKKFRPAT